MQLCVLFVGLVMAAATLLTIDLKLAGGLIPGSGGLAVARTAGFTMLVLAQLFKCLNSRSERESAFRGMFGNTLRWFAIVVSLAPRVLVVHVPLFNDAFTATPLSAGDWALCAGMASSVLWIDELKKLIVRRRHGRADERRPHLCPHLQPRRRERPAIASGLGRGRIGLSPTGLRP